MSRKFATFRKIKEECMIKGLFISFIFHFCCWKIFFDYRPLCLEFKIDKENMFHRCFLPSWSLIIILRHVNFKLRRKRTPNIRYGRSVLITAEKNVKIKAVMSSDKNNFRNLNLNAFCLTWKTPAAVFLFWMNSR